MQTATAEKVFTRDTSDLVKHNFNGYDFLTIGTDEPSDKLKALAVTLRDEDYCTGQIKFEDMPVIIEEELSDYHVRDNSFQVWQNLEMYKTKEWSERDYDVMTDSEADKAWDESLDSYIDECLDIPENVRFYFDEEKWKDDAKIDGRGHSLNRYDGSEEEANINDTDYYIYRTN